MFVTCPHCGFLVALVAARNKASQRCPRCDGLLQAGTDAGVAANKAAPTAEPAPAPASEQASTERMETPAATVATTVPAVEDAVAARTEAPAPELLEPAARSADEAAGIDEADGRDGSIASAESPAPATQTPSPSLEEAIAASSLAPAKPRKARANAARTRATPSFARMRTAEPTRKPQWRGYAAIAGLSLLLALQLLLAQRHELAAQERWRPTVAAVCGVLRCELPPWREPTAFTMLNRSVQPKVGMPGVLTVSASFRNDARWPQPWPTLVLSLSDVDGQPVGQRDFAATEYRNGDGGLLEPGQSATVQLDVVEPAPRIVAFTFDFR